MRFQYTLKTKSGKTVTGTVEAASEAAATSTLQSRGALIELTSIGSSATSLEINIPFLNRISAKDIVFVSRQLATMVEASLPITEALRILEEQSTGKLGEVVADLRVQVAAGGKLSAALASHHNVFDEFFVAMVQAGEATGKLNETLNFVADQKEREYEFRGNVISLLTYPAFIVGALLLIGFGVIVFIIPQLTEILIESGGELPIATRLLIGLSDFVRAFWYIIIVALIGIPVGGYAFLKTDLGKTWWSHLILRLPGIQGIVQNIYVAQLSESLSTLVGGGVPLPQTLQIVHDAIGNTVYQGVIAEAQEKVAAGESISKPFIRNGAIPLIFGRMLAVGEETGQIDKVMKQLSKFLIREVNNQIKSLLGLVEPLIFILLGVGAAILVAAVLLPIYNMGSSI